MLESDRPVGRFSKGGQMAVMTEKSATRRQRVLDAALDVFSREGYGNAAVDEIARRSDTSKGGVYFHFPSKQVLFLALVDTAGKLLLDRVRQAIASETTAVAKGDAALLAVLRTFGSHRSLARLLLIEALGAGREFTDHLAELHAEFARVIETYLAHALGYPWDRVHAEAERLEHAVSDELVDRMASAVGEPATDPHGHPIPTREGIIDETRHRTLSDVARGQRSRVTRVSDEDSELLRYLARIGIRPGVVVQLSERAPFDGPLTLQVGKGSCQVGPALASRVMVELLPD